jgi:hypothetical protein
VGSIGQPPVHGEDVTGGEAEPVAREQHRQIGHGLRRDQPHSLPMPLPPPIITTMWLGNSRVARSFPICSSTFRRSSGQCSNANTSPSG